MDDDNIDLSVLSDSDSDPRSAQTGHITRDILPKDFRQLEGTHVTARQIVACSNLYYPAAGLNRENWVRYEIGERPKTPLQEIIKASIQLKQNKRHVAMPYYFDVYGCVRAEHGKIILGAKKPDGQPWFPDKKSAAGFFKKKNQYELYTGCIVDGPDEAPRSRRGTGLYVTPQTGLRDTVFRESERSTLSVTPHTGLQNTMSEDIDQSSNVDQAVIAAPSPLHTDNEVTAASAVEATTPFVRDRDAILKLAMQNSAEREAILKLATQFTESQEEWRQTILDLKDRLAEQQRQNLQERLDRATRRIARQKRKHKSKQRSTGRTEGQSEL